jgi:hypothetical protein
MALHRRARFVLLAMTLVVAVVLTGCLPPAPNKVSATGTGNVTASSVGSSGLGQAAGVYPGYSDMSALGGFESWLGRDVNYVVQFGDQVAANFLGSIWGQVTKAGQLQTIAGRVTLVESVPLAFGSQLDANTAAGQAAAAANLTATVNGSNDSKFRQAAVMLQQGGYGDAIIRIGWEFDGGWYPWSSNGNCALWQNAFRHVHDVFTSVSPNFRFDWNGNSTSLKTQAACAYPGDAYVDIIGLDNYDMGLSAPYNTTTHTWADPNTAFSTAITPNLQFQRDFAIAHHKQVSFPEWGLFSGDGHILGGGDNPVYIQRMHDWMAALPATGPASLAYQSYFNYDDGTGPKFNLKNFPKSQALYRTLFR